MRTGNFVVLVAVFGYLLVQIINYQRAQEYRESLTDGISYVISEGVARQPGKQQKIDWVSDASDLLELPIYYTDASKVELSRTEKNESRLKNLLSVTMPVIVLRISLLAYVMILSTFIYKVDKITERQMKALLFLYWII